MPTPLCDALRAFAAAAPLRMHMPGHHGKPLPGFPEWTPCAPLDFTELPPTGDLFSPGGPIDEAEDLWAKAVGMAACLFLTGGSTQGLHAALTLACRPGDAILVDRGSHRAVYHALALLDLRPVYLPRPWLSEGGITGPSAPQEVETLLDAHPNIKTVCITSPTYYGVLSNIPAIAAAVHARGGKVVVDGAHGAHLPFLGENPFRTADLVVVSAHKTLPAPGQSALLFSGGAFSMDDLRRGGAIYGSSSPSYPLMAALDAARDEMEQGGRERYRNTIKCVEALRRTYPLSVDPAILDPARLVIPCGNGFAAQMRLMALGVYPEMADRGHVVFIPTCADGEEDFARLTLALAAADLGTPSPLPPPPPIPQAVLTPREALFAPGRALPLAEAEGLVLGEQVAPYPPGVPVVAPGERLMKKQLSYLREVEYNVLTQIRALLK